MSSIVVNKAGEWKLTGFEYAHPIEDTNVPPKALVTLDRYDPPEKNPVSNLKGGRNSNSIPTESGVDSWGLGCLIWEIFNGLLPNTNALQNPGSRVQIYTLWNFNLYFL
jgi:SCY1-like protein 1